MSAPTPDRCASCGYKAKDHWQRMGTHHAFVVSPSRSQVAAKGKSRCGEVWTTDSAPGHLHTCNRTAGHVTTHRCACAAQLGRRP